MCVCLCVYSVSEYALSLFNPRSARHVEGCASLKFPWRRRRAALPVYTDTGGTSMQKLRRVEIKEGEIRLVRHFKYEVRWWPRVEDECDWSGQVDLTGARLPVVLTSPSGKRESCTNTVEGRRAREGWWVVDKSNAAPNATIFCPVRYTTQVAKWAHRPPIVTSPFLREVFHFVLSFDPGNIISRVEGRGKRKHFRPFPSILISPIWQMSKQPSSKVSSNFSTKFFFSKKWDAKIIFFPLFFLDEFHKKRKEKRNDLFSIIIELQFTFYEKFDEGINDSYDKNI